MSRRDHQCMKLGCDSEAAWMIGINLLMDGAGEYRRKIKGLTSFVACGAHREEAMRCILSPKNRDKMTAYFLSQNYRKPDFDSAEFVFVRIDHDTIEDELAELRGQNDNGGGDEMGAGA